MAVDIARPLVRLAPAPPIFNLPEHVAIEQGLFERVGIDVRWAGNYLVDERDLAQRSLLDREMEASFETGKSDVYTACEWGTISRVERTVTEGKVYHLRPAVAAQAIVSFDPTIQEPRDLAGVPVGVNEFTGSHFTTIQMLGNALPKDQIVVEHIGAPEFRLDQLRTGKIRVATVMEPFISLALKAGAHIVASIFYRGAYIIAPHLSRSQRDAYIGVINEAVDLINADFARYKHYVAANAHGELLPEELSSHFVRYTHVLPFPEERFVETYEWMKAWSLTDGRHDFESLITA